MGLSLYAVLGHFVIEVKKNETWQLQAYDVGHKFLCLTTDPVRPGRFYAGTFDEGLWISDDYGESWEPAGSGIKHNRIFRDRKSTRLNSSHVAISYAVFCLKKKNKHK